MSRWWVGCLWWAACSGGDTGDDGSPTDGQEPRLDADNDGFDSIEAGGTDCNDEDASVNPTADEHCDGVDEDCNGVVDDETALDALELYVDGDMDGYGDAATKVRSCEPIPDRVENGDDCNDVDDAIHPRAAELCNEGVDDDCDPATLETAMIGEDGFATLNDAVAVAPNDAVIELCDGVVYGRRVAINRPVTITSSSGTREGSTLDGGGPGMGPIFVVGSEGELTLRALTVAHADAGAVDALSVGGGIVLVEDVLFDGNVATGAGGAIAGSWITVTDSTFTGNSAEVGGAVFATTPNTLTITDSTFEGNTAVTDGGAIATATTAVLSGVELRANSAMDGGAVHVTGAQVQISNGVVETNSATRGGGVHLTTNAAVQVANTDFGTAATDNLPDDVFLDGPDDESFSTFGANTSFTCSSATTCLQ